MFRCERIANVDRRRANLRADAEKIHFNRDDLAVQFLEAITSRTVDWP